MEVFHRFDIVAMSLFGLPGDMCNDVRTIKHFHRFSIVGCWLVKFELGRNDDDVTMKDFHRFFIGAIIGVFLAFYLQLLYLFGILNQGGMDPSVNPRRAYGLLTIED